LAVSDSRIERVYGAAISRVVKPGDVVLDLGGGFGRRAVHACRSGAARVFSVQPASTADVARAVVDANQCRDRVEIISDLPAAAPWFDQLAVVIAETGGDLPIHGASLSRYHRRGCPWPRTASTIPRRETLRAAIVSAPALLAKHLRPWQTLGRRWDMSVPLRMAQNVWSAGALAADQFATEPIAWATVEHEHAPAIPAGIEAVLEWHVESSRDAHGIAVWPAVELAEGLVIGNEPGTFVAADGYAYFPWPAPVTLAAGDGIAVTLRAEPLATGWESCLWNWSTTVTGVGLPAPGGRRFVQSNFLGSLDLIATAAGLSAAVARAENK
jgi:protein arginine N-methyltransferase 1